MQCMFCAPALNREHIVMEEAHCLFVQQPEPVLVGSGLIIPRRHRETPFDLTPGEWEETFALLQRAKALLDREFAPDGYNVGWNCGQAAGQEVAHAHLHVIPRYVDEPLRARAYAIG